MSDDFGEGLATVVAVIMAAALAIYLLILAIPFILYALAVYHGGVKFSGQLRHYELGGTGWLVLLGLGAVSVSAVTVPVLAETWHPISILLAVPLFLVLAVTTLGAWALARQWPYRERVWALEARVREAQERATAVEEEVALMDARARALESEHGDALRTRDELLAVVDQLCETDAQVWGVRRRRWEGEFRQLPEGELIGRLREAGEQLRRATRPGADDVGPAIRGCLLRVEELRRLLRRPDEELARLRGALQTRTRAREEARARAAELRLDHGRAAAALDAFRSSRMPLG